MAPHVLEVFFSRHCPRCTEAVHAIRQFASTRSDVVVIDRDIRVDANFQLAKRHGLIVAPALLINGETVLYGVPRAARLAARLDARSSV
ncbi:MAG: thioredoxin family protein [Vicinamibacterales bacterium]